MPKYCGSTVFLPRGDMHNKNVNLYVPSSPDAVTKVKRYFSGMSMCSEFTAALC